MFAPINSIPRHCRQEKFEELFSLGEKEVLFKTFKASMAGEGEIFASSGKLWVSCNHVCFSASSWRRVFNFKEIVELKQSWWSITLVCSDGNSVDISGLWKKEECFQLLNSIWWCAPAKSVSDGADSSSSLEANKTPRRMTQGKETPRKLTLGRKSAAPSSPVTEALEVEKTLDELDIVADLLLLPSESEKLSSPIKDKLCDQYGFPFENDVDRMRYSEFMEFYQKEQERMGKRWMAFLQRGDQDLLHSSNTEELKYLLFRGIPPSLRPSLYFRISGAINKRNSAEPDYYEKLSEQAKKLGPSTDWGRTIEKDLLRTFPYHPDFNESGGCLIEPMRNILLAYALRNQNVGYCQGMNFVCGALLVLFKEVRKDEERDEKTFWVLATIVEDLLPAYYAGDMIGSMVDQHVLTFYVQKWMPKLFEKFENVQYPISLVLLKWMNCLFWLNAPAETAARVMDVVMLLGSDALVEFSLGFLSALQSKILACEDLSEVSGTLDKSMLQFYPTPRNVELMGSFIGQLKPKELTSKRHSVYGEAENRIRAYSIGKALDRMKSSITFLEENDLAAIQDHWQSLILASSHKDGLDKETFCEKIGCHVFNGWPKSLLGFVFDFCNRSGVGVITLIEWARVIECLGSKRGKMKLLYGICGGEGDPTKIANVFRLLCEVWKIEGLEDSLKDMEAGKEELNPESFVIIVKTKFPAIFRELQKLSVQKFLDQIVKKKKE